MATKKPKTSAKTSKAKSTKPKTAAKTVDKPVSEAPITKKEEKVETVEATTKATSSCFKGFFSKKYETNEGILTVFKNPKFYGALVGEILGTALLTIFFITLSFTNIASIANYAFVLVAILIAVYAFSGACLNPIITAGMMASRRMSVIRGVMYIIAEIIGAWLGWLIINLFHLGGGESAYDIPTMTAVAEGAFWVTALVELVGAVIIAFFFARALKYKRSVFTFGATISGGIILAVLFGYIVSAAFYNLQGNFIFNPATALMLQIFPTAGESFGEIIGGIGQALAIYALFPMIGGICGFYLSDFASKLSGEE